MAKCIGYYTKLNDTQWRGAQGPFEVGQGAPSKHAEQKAGNALTLVNQSQAVLLFVLDEFPCEHCRTYMLGKSKSYGVIILVHGATGYGGNVSTQYHADWGFTAQPPLPQVIYVQNQKITFPGMVSVTTWVPAPTASNPAAGSKVTTVQLNAVNPETCQRPTGFPAHPSLAGMTL